MEKYPKCLVLLFLIGCLLGNGISAFGQRKASNAIVTSLPDTLQITLVDDDIKNISIGLRLWAKQLIMPMPVKFNFIGVSATDAKAFFNDELGESPSVFNYVLTSIKRQQPVLKSYVSVINNSVESQAKDLETFIEDLNTNPVNWRTTIAHCYIIPNTIPVSTKTQMRLSSDAIWLLNKGGNTLTEIKTNGNTATKLVSKTYKGNDFNREKLLKLAVNDDDDNFLGSTVRDLKAMGKSQVKLVNFNINSGLLTLLLQAPFMQIDNGKTSLSKKYFMLMGKSMSHLDTFYIAEDQDKYYVDAEKTLAFNNGHILAPIYLPKPNSTDYVLHFGLLKANGNTLAFDKTLAFRKNSTKTSVAGADTLSISVGTNAYYTSEEIFEPHDDGLFRFTVDDIIETEGKKIIRDVTYIEDKLTVAYTIGQKLYILCTDANGNTTLHLHLDLPKNNHQKLLSAKVNGNKIFLLYPQKRITEIIF